MAERAISKAVELGAGEHAVVELGELQSGERLLGSIKDLHHDKFMFVILDEGNYKRFMETEDEAEDEEAELQVLEEGDGKGHYRLDADIEVAGKYYLIIESTAAAMKRKISVELRITAEKEG